MKKNLLLIALFFCVISSYSQGTKAITTGRIYKDMIDTGFFRSIVHHDNRVEGTPYLFKNWLNSMAITASDGKNYTIPNSNYDALSDSFVAEISKDSVYRFNDSGVDYIFLKGIKYKKYKLDGKNNFYAILFDGERISMLKRYISEIKEGKVNRMTGAKITKNKYILKEKYYVYKNRKLTKIKLKKKQILNLLKDKKQNVKKFVLNKDLSYSKEEDILKIFEYYNSI
ncbi:hypothetical protein C7447_103232 [Tenacibaculum adriaticum]|uniref:DKNYY family protein n=1 Tax=Tenacibaculum adriaticum TaxID=413713 RepID=A0A5S5DQW6_9FLAO|nr:hypothetical protein [Tenacibaculum adriaticum]TYP98064.1 hypothetical protein C7447_103232 [Tenacibaculum adriaticum]